MRLLLQQRNNRAFFFKKEGFRLLIWGLGVCVVGEVPLLSLEDRMARDVREHQMALLQSHTGDF